MRTKWTPDRVEWVRRNAPLYTRTGMAERLSITTNALDAAIAKHGFRFKREGCGMPAIVRSDRVPGLSGELLHEIEEAKSEAAQAPPYRRQMLF